MCLKKSFVFHSCRILVSVEYRQSEFASSKSLAASYHQITQNQSGSSKTNPKSLVIDIFMTTLPSIITCLIYHSRATTNLKELLHLMDLEIEKILSNKPRVSINMSSLCHKHAVTMLTQPSHVDEHLRKRLPPENFPRYNLSFPPKHCSPYWQARHGVKLLAAPPSQNWRWKSPSKEDWSLMANIWAWFLSMNGKNHSSKCAACYNKWHSCIWI